MKQQLMQARNTPDTPRHRAGPRQYSMWHNLAFWTIVIVGGVVLIIVLASCSLVAFFVMGMLTMT